MTAYSDFEQYFKDLVDNHDQLQFITFVNGWQDIMDLQLAFDLYPALVVEIPDVDLAEEGGASLGFDFAFSVIKNTPKGELPEFYRTILNEQLKTAIGVRNQIFCDSEEVDDFDADLGTTFQRIVNATNDNCFGWRGTSP